MRYLQMTSACLLLMMVLAACQSVTSEFIPSGTQAETSNPLLTPKDTDMAPPITPDTNAQKMIDLVKKHLAQTLGIAAEQIVLSEVNPAQWRDGSLGCPKPAIDYIPMKIPGYRILLEAGGKTYTYHTDQANRFVMCNRP